MVRKGFTYGFLRRICAFASASLLCACSGGGWKRIPADKVRQLLPRYALLAAALQDRNAPDSVRVTAYKQFLEKEGYTLTDWDSTMAWYAKNNMPLYYDFYRLTSDSLNKEADRLQLKQDSIFRIEELANKRRNYNLDSVNLLSLGTINAGQGDLVNQTFSIAPSPAYTGAELELSTRVLGLSLSDGKKSPLTLYLQLVQSDSTVSKRSLLIKKSGTYSVKLKTKAGLSVVRVQGYLQGIVASGLKGKRFIFLDSLRLRRYPSVDESNDVPSSQSSTDSIPAPTTADTQEVIEM